VEAMAIIPRHYSRLPKTKVFNGSEQEERTKVSEVHQALLHCDPP